MPLVIEREAFGRVHEMEPPADDAVFLRNVDEVARLLGVGEDERTRALGFLALEKQKLTEEDFFRQAVLLDRARELAKPFATIETEETVIAPSLSLLEGLCAFDYDLAEEGVDVAELGLSMATQLSEITGAVIDLVHVWSDGLGHDDGKRALDLALNRKSIRGEEWTSSDIESMKDHSSWGYILAIAAGLPRTIAELIYANHAKQQSPTYGGEIVLDPSQRLVRDLVAGADDLLARMTRSNSGNKYQSETERWEGVLKSLLWRFGDYDHLSGTNNPDNIAREMLEVGQEFVSARYMLEQQPDGLVVTRKLGARALVSS